MRYAIYSSQKDGSRATWIVKDAQERDKCIDVMLTDDAFDISAYAPIYKSGEYGKRVFVKGTKEQW